MQIHAVSWRSSIDRCGVRPVPGVRCASPRALCRRPLRGLVANRSLSVNRVHGCKDAVRSCKIPVRKCKDAVRRCKISVRRCKILVRSLQISRSRVKTLGNPDKRPRVLLQFGRASEESLNLRRKNAASVPALTCLSFNKPSGSTNTEPRLFGNNILD